MSRNILFEHILNTPFEESKIIFDFNFWYKNLFLIERRLDFYAQRLSSIAQLFNKEVAQYRNIYDIKKATIDKYSSDSSILDVKEKKSRIYQIY